MNRDSLPQNYQRIADDFTGLDASRKAALIGHLEGAKDAEALNKTVDQIIHNGGPEAELVARIFQRNYAGDDKKAGIRTVNNKPLTEIQKDPQSQGTGAPPDGSVPHEEPHTSRANPPVPGHPVTKVTAEGTSTPQPNLTRRTGSNAGE